MLNRDARIFGMNLDARQQLFQAPVRRVGIVARSPSSDPPSNNIHAYNIPQTALMHASPTLRKHFSQAHASTKTYDTERRSVMVLKCWIEDLQSLTDIELSQSAPDIRNNNIRPGFGLLRHKVDIYTLLSRLRMDRCARKWSILIQQHIQTEGVTWTQLLNIDKKVPKTKCYQTIVDQRSQTTFNDVLFWATESALRQYKSLPGYAQMSQRDRDDFTDYMTPPTGLRETKLYRMIRYHELRYQIGQGRHRYPTRQQRDHIQPANQNHQWHLIQQGNQRYQLRERPGQKQPRAVPQGRRRL